MQPNNSEINYSALHDRSRFAKVTLYIGIACSVIFVSTLLLMTVSVFVAHGQVDDSTGENDTIIAAVFMACFFGSLGVMFVSAIVYAVLNHIRTRKRFERFLTDNGWSFDETISVDNIATSLVGVEGFQRAFQGVSGEYRGMPFKACLTSVSKYETALNIQFALQQQFPMLILEENSNALHAVIGSRSNILSDGRTLKLEGDFNKRFRLTAVEGTERDALRVFTPDFMHELMAKPRGTEIELASNHLYITCSSDSYTEDVLKKLFATADIVLKHLGEMKFAWQASSSVSEIEAMVETARLTRQRTFRRNFIMSIVVAAGGVVLYILIQLLSYMSQ